jgi:cobalt-zinc-cadmium efflux system outer membrane protein
VDAATLDRDLLAVDRQASEIDALAEVTRRFIDVVAAQEQLTLAHEAADLVQRTAEVIDIRVQAARSPKAELNRARIAVLRAQAENRQAESVLAAARRALVALWGGTEPHFDTAQGDFYTLPALDSFETLQARVERNPGLSRFATEARLRDAQLRLAQAQARPNLTLGIGVRRYEASNDVGLVAGFSIALPVPDRNQGAIAEASARRQQSRAEEKATRVRIQATLFGLFQQVVASRDELATLRDEAIPQARAALEQTQYGYERGRFSYLELSVAQQELLGLRAAVIGLATDSHRLTAEIERLTSEPLVRSSNDMDPLP